MSEPSKHDPTVGGFADPTRDIRLPPLPGRVLPPQWRNDDDAAAAPVVEAPPAQAPVAETPAEPGPPSISDEPTDNLAPPGTHPRHKTLTFGAPGEEGGSPAAVPPHYSLPRVVPAPPRARRWPWAVLIALPLIVIAVAAVLLVVLLRGA